MNLFSFSSARSRRVALTAVLVLAPGSALGVLSPLTAYASSGSGSSGQGGDQRSGSLTDAAKDAADARRDAADDRAGALADAADRMADARRAAAERVVPPEPEPEHRVAPAPVRAAGVRAAVVRAGTPEPARTGKRSPQGARPSARPTSASGAAAAAPQARLVAPSNTLSTVAAVPPAEGSRSQRVAVPLVGMTLGEVSPAALGRATALAGAGLLALLGLYGAALQASRSLRRPPE